MADDLVRLKIDGDEFTIDMTDLELGEIGTVEDLIGKSVQEIDWASARGTQGLVWIAKHRRDPRFSIEEAGRIKFTSITDPDEKPAKARPTKPA